MPQNSDNRKIRLSTTVSGITIEVFIENPDDFSQGYAVLKDLSQRIPVEEARYFTRNLWETDGEKKWLSDAVSETSHRIALSLLDTWPEPKGMSEIASDTNLSTGGVHHILHGRRGKASDWFYARESEWGLTERGIERILTEILPNIKETVGYELEPEPLY